MSKAVIQPFEEYQKGRIMFVQKVVDLASNKDKYINALKSVGVMKLLGPLLSDPVLSIKQSAALAIGRLAKYDIELAKSVVDDNGRILKQLISSINTDNKFYKKTTCYVISSVSRSPELAKTVTNYGAISYLVKCLQEYDPTVKESAVWALGYIAKHTDELAELITREENAIDYLILCLQEPDTRIKSLAVQTLSNIAKHSRERANSVCQNENLNMIIGCLGEKDLTLKHKVCVCLANLAKNSYKIANNMLLILHQEVLRQCIKSNYNCLERSSINLLNELSRYGQELASNVNNKIGPDVIVRFLESKFDYCRVYTIPLISSLCKENKDIAQSYISEEYNVLKPIYRNIKKDKSFINYSMSDYVIDRIEYVVKQIEIEKCDKNNKIDQNKAKLFVTEVENELEIISLSCEALANLSGRAETANRIAEYNDTLLILLGLYCHIDKNTQNQKLRKIKENSFKALDTIIEYCEKLELLDRLLEKPETTPSCIYDLTRACFKKINYQVNLKYDSMSYEDILKKLINRQKELLNNKLEKKMFLERNSLQKILDYQINFPFIRDEINVFYNIFSSEIVNFYDKAYSKKVRDDYLNSMTEKEY